MDKIMVAGDLHGLWGPLNTLIDKKAPEIILQCGDFGWWPRFHKKRSSSSQEYGLKDKLWDQYGLKPQKTKIYFCPGNHEDWDDLLLKGETSCEIMPNVFYMPRGTLFTLPDNRIVLFMGGGDSIDKNYRVMGRDWFPQELIPYSEFYKLQERKVNKIDIVISHTCPLEFVPTLYKNNVFKTNFHDSSQEVLSAILQEYKPSLWYFGHFHANISGRCNNTYWYCLNDIPNTQWWRYLHE